jgi:hypothetical protein
VIEDFRHLRETISQGKKAPYYIFFGSEDFLPDRQAREVAETLISP